MLNFWLEDRYFLPGKSMELSFNFGIIDHCNFQKVILENLNLAKIKFLWRNNYLRAIRISADIKKIGLIIIGSNYIDVKREGNLSQFASY